MGRPIPYEFIRNSIPESLQKKPRSCREIKAWQAALYFAAVMILLFTLSGHVYAATGSMTAEAFAQQLMFLFSALLFVKLMRGNFRRIFPVKKPHSKAVAGCLLLVTGSFLLADVYSLLILHLSPGSLQDISDEMREALTHPNPAVELLLTAVCPAVCEEAMHRGVMLHSLDNSFRNKWISIVLSAAVFGVFHVSPVRMFMPAVLGILIGIVVLETGNMVYGALIHFCYNGILTMLSRMSQSLLPEGDVDLSLSSSATGIAVITVGMLIPFFLWTGLRLVRLCTSPRRESFVPENGMRRMLLQILLPTLGIIFTGILVIFTGN